MIASRRWHQLTWNVPVFLSVPAAIRILKWVYVGMHFAVLNPMLGRIAVGLYTLSLLGKNSRAVRYTIWFLMFQQIVHNVGIAGVLLHVCGTDPKEIAKYDSHIVTPVDDICADMVNSPTTTCFRQSPWSRYAEFVGGKTIIQH